MKRSGPIARRTPLRKKRPSERRGVAARKDAAYLAFVRRQPCMFDWVPLSDCSGPLEAHHYPARGMGGVNGHDRRTVPLCDAHHREFHNRGSVDPFSPLATVQALLEEQVRLLILYNSQGANNG